MCTRSHIKLEATLLTWTYQKDAKGMIETPILLTITPFLMHQPSW
jgi:hypothetical protein